MQRRNHWLLYLTWAIVAISGCQQRPPDRWESAQAESSRSPEAVSSEAVEGSQFNRFFPQVEAPWDIVFKQEKTGFAQASLHFEGREVAVLSVSDTRNNPEAADKFKNSQRNLEGMPVATIGEQATAILVNDRFQIQVRSMDPVIGPQERDEWLTRFDWQAIGRIQ